jgi:hypothetical protein
VGYDPVERKAGRARTETLKSALTNKCEVELTCHHIVLFAAPWPQPGHTVYCRRCQVYRQVKAELLSYRCLCQHGTRRCRITQDCGDNIGKARAIASEHVMANPSPHVEIMCNYQTVEHVRYSQDPAEHPYAGIGGARQTVANLAQETLNTALDKLLHVRQSVDAQPHDEAANQEGPKT